MLVANQVLRVPQTPLIQMITVSRDFDSADNYIVQNLASSDLVITADVPLADLVVAKQACAINPRGEIYTAANIKDRLSTRNLMAELRSSGQVSGGPREFSTADVKSFASAFDRELTARLKR